jgi:hypothetical protein
MKIEILEIVRREYDEAKEFYETEQPGLGSQFKEQIRHSLLRIQQYPQNSRSCIRAFHRQPDYWIDRQKLNLVFERTGA